MERYGISFKEMSKKEKVKHIWEYYRYHILSSVIAICVTISLVKTVFFPAPPNDVDIMLAGIMYLEDTYTNVSEEFKENYNTGLDLTNINWEDDPQTAGVMYQKVPLMLSTKELDIIGISTSTYERFAKMYGEDMFMPMENVPELSGLLEKYEDHLYVCDKIVDEEGNEIDAPEKHVLGIKVEKFSNIPCLTANEEMIVGLNPGAKDLEKAINMLEYILE